MAPRIFIFSIVLGAEYLFYVKSIATYTPTFLGYNNSVLAIVENLLGNNLKHFGPNYIDYSLNESVSKLKLALSYY